MNINVVVVYPFSLLFWGGEGGTKTSPKNEGYEVSCPNLKLYSAPYPAQKITTILKDTRGHES